MHQLDISYSFKQNNYSKIVQAIIMNSLNTCYNEKLYSAVRQATISEEDEGRGQGQRHVDE